MHFVCANELPFWGNEKDVDVVEGEKRSEVIFVKLFQYTSKKDSKLMNCYNTIPEMLPKPQKQC